MPNRILKESITTSPSIDALSAEAEVLFYRLLVQADDYGRLDGRLNIIRARCFPLRIDRVTAAQVGRWLAELTAADLVRHYDHNNIPYLYFPTWANHQQIRAARSRHPAPPQPGQAELPVAVAEEPAAPPIRGPKPKASAAPVPRSTQQALFGSVQRICGMEGAALTESMRRQIAGAASQIARAGGTAEGLKGFSEWWARNDWRGKKGQLPTPMQVASEWPKYTANGHLTGNPALDELYSIHEIEGIHGQWQPDEPA